MIKWDGYLTKDNTWEPLHIIYYDIKALCRKYFRDRGLDLICKSGNLNLANLDTPTEKFENKFKLVKQQIVTPRIRTAK